MTGVSPPPHLLGAWYIRWGIHQTKLTVYMTIRRQRQLDCNLLSLIYQTDYQVGKWRYPPSWIVVMFSRSKHLTVLYRYSQLLYIDIFH